MVQEAMDRLKQDIVAMTDKLAATIRDSSTLENTLMRSRYLLDVANDDAAKLRRLVQRHTAERQLFERTVHHKQTESVAAREKSLILNAQLGAESQTYMLTMYKIADLRAELDRELVRMADLRRKTQHTGALRLEMLRLEKAKLTMDCKCRALEDEMQTPMNVHRWRFLEATNPEISQMIKITDALRTKCMDHVAVLLRYRASLKELQHKIEVLCRRIRRTSVADHDDAMRFYESLLRQKSQQLGILTAQIAEHTSSVEDSKFGVDDLRAQLRDAKGDYFTDKKANDVLRSKSHLQKKVEEKPAEAKYIGGGFAVAGYVNRSIDTSRPRPLINSQTSSIVAPKVATSLSRKQLPLGWNPSRKPLHPVLPTVTHLQNRFVSDTVM
jgi:hypothetical protein